MRGDRPNTGSTVRVDRQATPHARGSTRPDMIELDFVDGYPACAGIDLAAIRPQTGGSGLPRMRGDRPDAIFAWDPCSAATPHARGSTPRRAQHRHRRRGYPACAGIDPAFDVRYVNRVRLPRMRGDRPVSPWSAAVTASATPHARGSTLSGRGAHLLVGGYPACAGIDPYAIGPDDYYARLPRMRGDRPSCLIVTPRTLQATPHARGSTSVCLIATPQACGYPACAGIDLWEG